MKKNRVSRLIKSQITAYAVASFFGFSVGLLVAAQFFPTRIERVEIVKKTPAPSPTPPPIVQPEAKPKVSYDRLDVDQLPGWKTDSVADALPALRNACSAFEGRPDTESVGRNGIGGTVADWRAPCVALGRLAYGDANGLREILSSLFVPYAVSSSDGATGKFTGYYEAALDGSSRRTEKYFVPLYGLPKDIIELDPRSFDLSADIPSIVGQVGGRRLIPYDERRVIEKDESFSERAEVLVWVDDPVDAHLLHIQGSGRVTMDDGTERRIGYAGNNGRRFRGIGGILLSAGVLGPGQSSMPTVAKWLRDNPVQAQRYMEDNPRFIFFRWNDGPGPLGALGVPLEPRRSLAVDPRYIPYGAPLWLDVDDPDGQSLDGLVVALDTGSAIRGPVRGDYFWGAGPAAFAKAGRMNSRGRYYLFLPRSVADPSYIGEKPL